ncbi:hypothetical protein PoB_001523400 [Plakobranchus ocellatus]|uniref:Uncharacterized protein n=1 Tax=Plakobranchus ocellatus TaxID=259542 RepID=A0AAV3Z2X6_9GAST|nr:hypothetical protein PoB_001523400 [Plakobranchus ocellatus]
MAVSTHDRIQAIRIVDHLDSSPPELLQYRDDHIRHGVEVCTHSNQIRENMLLTERARKRARRDQWCVPVADLGRDEWGQKIPTIKKLW